MTDKKASDNVLMIRNVRIAFPAFFNPKQVNGEGEAKFSGAFIMPKDHPDVGKVRAAIQAVAKAKWGDEAPAILKMLIAKDRVCLHDGDFKSNYDGFPGNFYVSASSKTRPLCIDGDKSPLVESDGKLYAGAYANVQISIWAMDNQYGKRVNAQLRGVQFARAGDAFGGGGVAAVDDFDTVDASADEAAPAAEGWGDNDEFGLT